MKQISSVVMLILFTLQSISALSAQKDKPGTIEWGYEQSKGKTQKKNRREKEVVHVLIQKKTKKKNGDAQTWRSYMQDQYFKARKKSYERTKKSKSFFRPTPGYDYYNTLFFEYGIGGNDISKVSYKNTSFSISPSHTINLGYQRMFSYRWGTHLYAGIIIKPKELEFLKASVPSTETSLRKEIKVYPVAKVGLSIGLFPKLGLLLGGGWSSEAPVLIYFGVQYNIKQFGITFTAETGIPNITESKILIGLPYSF